MYFVESACPNPTCESVPASLIASPNPQRQRNPNESSVLASTTVTVLQPGDKPGKARKLNLL